MLSIGQNVVYRRSVCTVTDIIENYRDNKCYYKLTPFYESSLSIHTPVDCPEGLFKPLITKSEIEDLINKSVDIAPVDTSDRMLENVYKELFDTEKREDLIRVIKTARTRKEDQLSKGQRRCEKDRTYLRKAQQALYGEIAVVLGKPIDETREYILNRVSLLENTATNQAKKSNLVSSYLLLIPCFLGSAQFF